MDLAKSTLDLLSDLHVLKRLPIDVLKMVVDFSVVPHKIKGKLKLKVKTRGNIRCIAYCSKGNRWYLANENQIQVIDGSNGTLIDTWKGFFYIRYLLVDDDEEYVIIADYHRIQVRHTSDTRIIRKIHSDGILSGCLSLGYDGQRKVLFSTDILQQRIFVYDFKSGDYIKSLEISPPSPPHSDDAMLLLRKDFEHDVLLVDPLNDCTVIVSHLKDRKSREMAFDKVTHEVLVIEDQSPCIKTACIYTGKPKADLDLRMVQGVPAKVKLMYRDKCSGLLGMVGNDGTRPKKSYLYVFQ